MLAGQPDLATSVDRDGQTVLEAAADTGCSESAALLIAHGADPRAGDTHGNTPLHRAVNQAVAEVLVAHGADVNARDNYGYTPLHNALHGLRCNEALACFLIAAGADVNAENEDYGTPLVYAGWLGFAAAARMLLERGATLRTHDSAEGALIQAVLRHDQRAVESLLAGGADPSDASKGGGLSALGWATALKHKELAEILLSHGADLHSSGPYPPLYRAVSRPASEQEFLSRCTRVVERAVRVYTVEGHKTKIVVFEDEVPDLEAIRLFRLSLEGAPVERSNASFDPRLLRRALPEDFIPMLDALPDSRLIDRLYLSLHEGCPTDGWFQLASGDQHFEAQAVATSNGAITFYRKNLDGYLGDELRHEWVHLFRWQKSHQARAYDLAAEYEKNGYYHRPRARLSCDENHAVHMGEQFLHRAFAEFQQLARQAPVRMAVIGLSVDRLLQERRRSPGTPAEAYCEALTLRVRYVRELVLPWVVSDLVLDIETAPDAHAQQLPAKLLIFLGAAERLAGIEALTALDLSGEPVTIRQLEGLKTAVALESLDLSNTWLAPGNLRHFIRGLHRLRQLSLVGNELSHSDLSSLSDLTGLEHLTLQYADVKDYLGLVCLRKSPSLTYLDIEGTYIDGRRVDLEEVQRLEKLMPHCTIVHSYQAKDSRPSGAGPDFQRA